jgi:alpha-galactosidase
MNTASKTILTNANLIGINQDALGLQATQISNDGTRRILAKKLANTDVAVALFNQGNTTTTISTTTTAIGKTGTSFTLTDAWSNTTTTSTGTITASVPAHGTIVYRVSGGTSTPTSSPTPTPTSSPTPTPTTSPTTSPPASGPCRIDYRITNQWTGGFQADLTVHNTGTTTINGWKLAWAFPNGQLITQSWGATYAQTGSQVTVTNESWNGSIAPGATATFGFLANWTGTNTAPTAFALNGSACSNG